jgi:release factor glutamine methyltransferase
MQSTIQYINKELSGFYPSSEVHGFIRLILENVCQIGYSDIFLHHDMKISEADKEKIHKIVRRLKTFEPIQYILGETEFYNLKLKVKTGVFIPRPETEELVEWIINSNNLTAPEILDVGTGSGCIALALKKNIEGSRVTAIDILEDAIVVARENAVANKLEINFIRGDFFQAEHKTVDFFDIIVSNPPYVTEAEKPGLETNVLQYEPEQALFVPDNNPLKYYSAVAGFAGSCLKEGGWIYFEINGKFGNETLNLLKMKGFRNPETKKDINGKDRMVRCQK